MPFDPGDLISVARHQLFTFKAKHMLAERGYDGDWYREEPEAKGIMPRIPSRKAVRTRPLAMLPAIVNSTKLKTLLHASETGGLSHPAMIGA